MEDKMKDINALAGALCRFDHDRHDGVLTEKEYVAVQGDASLLKALTNSTKAVDWNGFKSALQAYAAELGLSWKITQGRGGPLKLVSVDLPKEMGTFLAHKHFKAKPSGDFVELLKEELPELYKLCSFDENLIDYSAAREGFTEYAEKNSSYRFTRGRSSTSFRQAVMEYSYGSDDKMQDEIELGKRLLEPLSTRLRIELDHTQVTRRGGKYQNADFVGYRIVKGLESDSIDLYALELKASNKIASVSEAISQAINYKAVVNFSYIIIPMFDEGLYPDDERFRTFVQLCRTNDIGIITAVMDTMTNRISDVYEVIAAGRNEIHDKSLVLSFIKDKGFEICPLCRRIVNKETRADCEWLVSIVEDGATREACMKLQMEERVRKNA